MKDFKMLVQQELLNIIRKLLRSFEESNSDDAFVFVGSDPGKVIVQVDSNKVTISIYSISWENPSIPSVRPVQLATLEWQRFPVSHLRSEMKSLIKIAKEIRQSLHRCCDRCNQTKPPESMHDGSNTCQACAVRFLGVIY